MAKKATIGEVTGNHSWWALQGRTRCRHWIALAALALLGLLGAGTASADSLALMTGAGQSGLGGSSSTQPLVVQVRDVNGAVVAGRTIAWSTSNGFLLSAPSSVTDANGNASVNFTYGNSGTTNIVANDSVGATSASAPETSIGSDSITLISGGGQVGQVGSASTLPIVVEIRNPAGTPVAGRTVLWSDQTAYTHVNAATSLTNANGQASMGFTYATGLLSRTGTPATIRAIDAVNSHFVDVTETTLGVDIVKLVSGQDQSGLVGSTGAPIVARVTDWNGNPLAGKTVTWFENISSGAVSLSSSSSITDANGNASITFQYLQAITGEITVDYNGEQSDMHFTGVSAGSLTLISAYAVNGPSGGVSPTPIVVEARAADGTPAIGRTINWTTTSGNAVPAAASSITDGTGRASVGFTFGTTGSSFITATDAVSGLTTFTLLNTLPTDSLRIVSGENQIGTAGSPAAQPIVVEVLDSAGAPVVGRSIDWQSPTGGGPILSAPTSLTNISGRASVSFSYVQAGSWQIRAGDIVSSEQAFITVSAVGVNIMTSASGDGQSGLPGTHGAAPLVAELRDASNQPIVGRTIDWLVKPGSSAILDAATSVTDGSGQASMGFTYGPSAQINEIGVTDSVNPGVNTNFGVTAVGADSLSIISGNGQVGAPNAAGAQPMVVEVRDAAGNPVAGRNVLWTFSAPPNAANSDANSSITNASGRASMTFHYGTGASSSILHADDAVTGQQVTFSMTATQAVNHALIVSGNGQTGQPGTAGAQPIVVELRDASNVPQPGQQVAWRVVSGPATLGANTVLTDANGQVQTVFNFGATPGTSIIEAYDPGNPVNGQRVQATVTALGASVVLATLPNLTPEQTAVAVALDNACPALADLSSPTPEQADLLARCQEIFASAGINPVATAGALEVLLSKTAQAQTTAASLAIDAQIQNIQSRLITLRSGAAATKSDGLSFTGPGGMVTLTSLLGAFMDETGTGEAGAGFSRWGFFATGNIGRGEARANSSSPGYDYDINGLTAGIDYRQRDNWVSGAALGYTRQDTDLANDAGMVALSGWSFSGYSTFNFKERWYVDGVVTYGHNRLTLERAIRYTLPVPGGGSASIDQLATGKPDGKIFSAAITLGGDFHRNAWGFSPYGQLIHARVDFDAYQESLHAGPGVGLGLAVDARRITSLTGILGTRLSYTRSTDWGVFAPTASLEWNHEFKSDPSATTARFIYDPTQTPFSVSGQPQDADYLRLGLGMTFMFTHGRSGFFLYQRTLARSGQSQDNLSLGLRIEL